MHRLLLAIGGDRDDEHDEDDEEIEPDENVEQFDERD